MGLLTAARITSKHFTYEDIPSALTDQASATLDFQVYLLILLLPASWALHMLSPLPGTHFYLVNVYSPFRSPLNCHFLWEGTPNHPQASSGPSIRHGHRALYDIFIASITNSLYQSNNCVSEEAVSSSII